MASRMGISSSLVASVSWPRHGTADHERRSVIVWVPWTSSNRPWWPCDVNRNPLWTIAAKGFWTPMLKIDTHAHYLPRDWPDLARKYGDDRFPVIHHTDDGRHRIYKDGKFFREIWSKTWDPQERIDDYARFGVQVQVISTVPVMFSYWAKPHHALELHQALNDHMAETCRALSAPLRRHRHGAAAVAAAGGAGAGALHGPARPAGRADRQPRQRLEPRRAGTVRVLPGRQRTGRGDPRAPVGHDGQPSRCRSTGCRGWSACRPSSRARPAAWSSAACWSGCRS